MVLGLVVTERDCLARLPSLTGSLGKLGLLGNSLMGELAAGLDLTGCSNLLGLCGLILVGKVGLLSLIHI